MKARVFLSQVNNQYGRGTFLPYSTGCLQAYALSQPDLAERYEFLPLHYLRENPEEVVQRIGKVDVAGFSSYIWNMEYNLSLAESLDEAMGRECIIVFGGPHVPERDALEFLDTYRFIDFLVHGEGEIAFAGILRQGPSFLRIPGVRNRYPSIEYVPPQRISDLSILPSPYLAGVFDDMPFDQYDFHAVQETHRGCPYDCTFCDWGSATYAKVRQFPSERIQRELSWIGHHDIELLYSADANYGLFARDAELTDYLIDVKCLYGYPKQFRAAYAKNSNDRVFDIAKHLHEAGMCKGVTLTPPEHGSPYPGGYQAQEHGDGTASRSWCSGTTRRRSPLTPS